MIKEKTYFSIIKNMHLWIISSNMTSLISRKCVLNFFSNKINEFTLNYSLPVPFWSLTGVWIGIRLFTIILVFLYDLQKCHLSLTGRRFQRAIGALSPPSNDLELCAKMESPSHGFPCDDAGKSGQVDKQSNWKLNLGSTNSWHLTISIVLFPVAILGSSCLTQ